MEVSLPLALISGHPQLPCAGCASGVMVKACGQLAMVGEWCQWSFRERMTLLGCCKVIKHTSENIRQ